MPAKKTTTTKKATTKKPVAKKPTVKKTVKRTTSVAKKPTTVIVKENSIKKETCNTPCGNPKAIATFAIILLVINTILLGLLVFKTTSQKALFGAMEEFEAMRVGGIENHNIMKEIYKLDAYKNDQKMRLETTLNALQQMNLQENPTELPTEIQ